MWHFSNEKSDGCHTWLECNQIFRTLNGHCGIGDKSHLRAIIANKIHSNQNLAVRLLAVLYMTWWSYELECVWDLLDLIAHYPLLLLPTWVVIIFGHDNMHHWTGISVSLKRKRECFRHKAVSNFMTYIKLPLLTDATWTTSDHWWPLVWGLNDCSLYTFIVLF